MKANDAVIAHCTFEISSARLKSIMRRIPATNNARLLGKLQKIVDGEPVALTVRQASDVRVFLLQD